MSDVTTKTVTTIEQHDANGNVTTTVTTVIVTKPAPDDTLPTGMYL